VQALQYEETEIRADERAESAHLVPWELCPYQLISWWDMNQFSAERAFITGVLLERLASIAAQHKDVNVEGAKKVLSSIDEEMAKIGLKISLKASEYVIVRLNSNDPERIEFRSAVTQLSNVIRWEMAQHLFMWVPSSRAERYDKEESFGKSVFDCYPSARFDIKEAGSSFAAGRFTACVFHLMRVLELGLAAFAKVFNVPSDHTNWHNIIEGIESKIRDMGKDSKKYDGWKEKQEHFAQAANSFMFFKDAWRNYTAHARGKYTEDEADSVYRNVRSFMQRLAQMGLAENS
jgi:hypothetical protein